ncbi:MAG: HNH endonuclease signature motif containing protein [Dehalococcoidales bacterium]|nr:HNH endonuclease signature motif containing protein [Dehalococcoidales bacterium]
MIDDHLKDSYGFYKVITGNEGSGRCWWCGADFPDTHARRYCSRKCRGNYQNNFYWTWASNAALRRDGYRCQECGVRGKRRLQVHHLVPLKGSNRIISVLNKPENLIVLCKKCHRKRHQTV